MWIIRSASVQTKIDGQHALVRCYGVAFHHRARITSGTRTRIFVGTYELELQASAGRWQISALTFKLKFIDGNLELERAV